MSHVKSIALVKFGRYTRGGLSSVCRFLHQTLAAHDGYEVALYSLDTTYNGPLNVRLLAPRSWLRGVQTETYRWNGLAARHIGTQFSELEFQRYMPRRALTDLLNRHDLIQVVSGSPAIAYIARDAARPVCVQAATTTRLERNTVLGEKNYLRKLYGIPMRPIINEIEKRVIQQADHIFADTAYTRQAFLPYTTADKITVDVIGVDTTRFQPLPEAERTDAYILSVGRLSDPRKNIALLVEAYARLRQRHPDAPRLVLAGSTAPPPAAGARARALGVADCIEVQENIPFEALVALHQNAAFFALSSDEEGLGIVLLEAMACATPVVATRCGGPDSVVSDDVGFLTPVGDAAAMAERMAWMLQHPAQRRAMGQAARAMIEARFANDVIGQKYLAVYDRLLS